MRRHPRPAGAPSRFPAIPRFAEWIGVSCIAATLLATAWIGARLIERAGRLRGAVEIVLEARHRLAAVQGTVANMEADRRAYQLTGMPMHLAALQQDHDRVHGELEALRLSVQDVPALPEHVAVAESLIGSWRDETAAAQTGSAAMAMDRAFLGTARTHLAAVSSALNAELRGAQDGAARARTRARWLWFAVMGLSLLVIGGLAAVASRRQARLRQQAREIERLLEALPFAVLSLDASGTVQRATGRAALLFASARSLVGRQLTDVVASLDRTALEQSLEQVRAGSAVTCEAQIVAEYEAPRALSFSLAPVAERGHTLGISVVVRDVTAERALRTQSRETGRLARLGTMAAGVAHELNGALTAIMGATALLERVALDPTAHTAVEVAQAEAARAARTVRIILDFSRRDAHRHEPLVVGEVVERAIALRRFDPRSRGVDFRLATAAGLPRVLGDTQELLQVFLNILANAEHAVQDQPVRRIMVEAWADDRQVFIAVSDTGPGIPEDHLERVFSPFYTTKPRGEGTGLGLALARGVVVEHRGTIHAERAVDGGARIVVILPALRESESAERTRITGETDEHRDAPPRIAAAS